MSWMKSADGWMKGGVNKLRSLDKKFTNWKKKNLSYKDPAKQKAFERRIKAGAGE